MLGAVCSLKCYVGHKQAGVLRTCTSGRCTTNVALGMYGCSTQTTCGTASGLECCCTDNCNDPNGSGNNAECKEPEPEKEPENNNSTVDYDNPENTPELSIASKTMCG